MKATMTEAKMIASAQSCMSETQNLFNKLASDAGAKQHTDHHRIQEVLDLRHALVPITQRAVNTVVPLRADGFVYSKLCLC